MLQLSILVENGENRGQLQNGSQKRDNFCLSIEKLDAKSAMKLRMLRAEIQQ